MKNGIRAVSVVLIVGAMYCPSALADEYTDNRITESALRETRDILSRKLLGHYDITDLSVKRIEDLRGLGSLRHDYGLVKATLTFSTKRNTTKHPNLNRDMFEPGSGMCQGSLYLHCGVPVGHVFEGRLEVLLAVDGDGSWRAVSPHTGDREGNIHSKVICSWRGGKRKGMCCSPSSRRADAIEVTRCIPNPSSR
jgi:hypothetical protein